MATVPLSKREAVPVYDPTRSRILGFVSVGCSSVGASKVARASCYEATVSTNPNGPYARAWVSN